MPPASGELIPIPQGPSRGALFQPGVLSPSSRKRLLEAFYGSRNPNTMRCYRRGIADFQAFLGVTSPDEAVAMLLGRGQGEANATILEFQEFLVKKGLAPATVNTRIFAIRSLAKLARLFGLVPWAIETGGMKTQVLRDTTGPGEAKIRGAIAALEAEVEASPLAARNLAIISLLYRQGFRRKEVVGLNIENFDPEKKRVSILGKGRTEFDWITLSPKSMEAMEGWIRHRGVGSGPLFIRLDRAGEGKGRLTGGSVWKWIHGLGLGRPHGIRHTAITEALDRTHGDVRKVQKFSRHRDLRMLLKYDDNRKDDAGEVAALLD